MCHIRWDGAAQVSAEGASLVETQTHALFGDVKELTKQMQEVVGEARSMEEVMQRVQVRLLDGSMVFRVQA